jgi:hypothetical protein
MYRRHFAFVLFVLGIGYYPVLAQASVSINEICWMGSAENANAEWIELYNDGASVDLTGWTLVATDGQPSITLAGTIGANAYFLLERTNDEAVPGVTAGQIYTGAMGNAGEVLELKDVNGAVVDSVDGSGDWAIGGDNTAKLTAQRNGSGWVTAQATPGRANASSDDQAYAEQKASTAATDTGTETGTTNTSSKSTTSGSKEKEVRMPPSPDPQLSVKLGNDVTVATGVPLSFTADVRKEGNKPFDINTIVWNFGDGATGEGKAPTHTYLYTGDYVVKVRATRTQILPPITAEDQLTVHVVPLVLDISQADQDSVEITNRSEHDVDLSNFTLAYGSTYFRIPFGTVILKGSHVRFAAAVTKLNVVDPRAVGIFTPGRVLVARFGDAGVAVSAGDVYDGAHDASSTGPITPLVDEELVGITTGDTELAEATASDTASLLPASVAYADSGGTSNNKTSSSLMWWILALVALVGTTATAVVLSRRERAEIIEGFYVESDE